jgi:hypothetical protein
MWGPRWLASLTFAIVVIIAGDAGAQAFKPRDGQAKPAPTKPTKPTKAAPAAAPSKKAARGTSPRRSVTTKTKAKKPSRAAQGRGRVGDLTPDPVKAGGSDADDEVTIVDDED